MTNENIIASLAYYYNHPIVDMNPQTGQGLPNPQFTEAVRWMYGKFHDEKAAERFGEKIKHSFKPTSTTPFPLLVDLEEIYDKNNVWRPGPSREIEKRNIAGILNDAGMAMDNGQGVRYYPPEGMSNMDIETLVEAADRLTATQMIKQYGIKLAMNAWMEQGRRMK